MANSSHRRFCQPSGAHVFRHFGGVTTCSGNMPMSDVTTGRPWLALRRHAASTGGSIAVTTTVSAAANAAGMSRQ